jgi:hypothetical protein
MHMLASLHAYLCKRVRRSLRQGLQQMMGKYNCCRTETAEFSKDDLYVARYDPIQTLLKEGWVHLI